jgi:type II secretory pathway pseudopilin PulG
MSSHQVTHTQEVHEQPDSWHRHAPAEGSPQHEHGSTTNPVVLASVFTIMVLSIVGSVAVLVIYFFSYATQLRAENIETTRVHREFQQYQAKALAQLGPKPDQPWTSSETVQIPIAEAMNHVASQYTGNEKPRAIGTPGATLPAAPATPASPAAPAPAPGSTPPHAK